MLRLARGYFWEGFTRVGRQVSGIQLGEQLSIIRSQLQQQGILVVQFRPVWRLVLGRQKVSPEEIVQFSRQLSHLLQAGFALVPALDCLAGQYTTNSSMQSILLGLKLALENGMALSNALQQYPTCFNKLYCYLVGVSERCGTLEEQLIQLADYHERLVVIKRNISKALYYPTALLGIACGVIILLFVLVIPKFEDLFHTVGATLPPLTSLLIKTARWLQSYGLLVGLSILGLSSVLITFKSKVQSWMVPFSHIILKLPWIGSTIHRAMVARFCHTLSTTLSAGLPTLEALVITREVMPYSAYSTALLKANQAVMNGARLDQALQETHCFPPLLIQMIAMGQSSGHLEKNLAQLANLLEIQVSDSTTGMISFLEPTLLVLLGGVIGTLMLALYWPIFELGNVVGLA